MGLYIAEMDMPENCYKCPVRNQGFSGDGMKCGKTGSVLSWYDGNRKRMDNCPLLFVSPHGRLVEDTAVIDKIDEWLDSVGTVFLGHGMSYYGELLGCIRDAPTIIPASGGKENE